MFSNESFYKKDKWLHSRIYDERIAPNVAIVQKIYAAYYNSLKSYAQKYRVDDDDLDYFAQKVILQFAVNQDTDKYEERSLEQERKYVFKIARFFLLKYWQKNKKQTEDMPLFEEIDDRNMSILWNSDNEESEETAFHNQKLTFLEECSQQYTGNGNERKQNNLDLLMSKYYLGLTYQEVAEIASTTEEGIKSRLRKIRESLEKCVVAKIKKYNKNL